MPRGDGKGPPWGSGPGTGRRGGQGGMRGGRMGGARGGLGPGGECVCAKCGATLPHQPGKACYELACPQCGAQMVRK